MSSGDLLADRRLEFARMLADRGERDGAASLLAEALERVPDWAPGHFLLAEMLDSLGRIEDASEHYRAYLRRVDRDVLGAEIRLALRGAAAVPERLPEGYVRALFDQYAPRFDESLIEGLAYRAPDQLLAAVERAAPSPCGGERILDLGCGTGLAGEAFRGRASWLDGIDLSPGMIAAARAKGVYDTLVQGEAIDALDRAVGLYDVVVAADVVAYLGELGPLFAGVARVLTPGGLFAVSAQRGERADYSLGPECRYSHTADHLRSRAAACGLDDVTVEDAVCRREAGRDVPSLIAVFRKPAPLVAGAPMAAATIGSAAAAAPVLPGPSLTLC